MQGGRHITQLRFFFLAYNRFDHRVILAQLFLKTQGYLLLLDITLRLGNSKYWGVDFLINYGNLFCK